MFVTECNKDVRALIFLMFFGGGNLVYAFFYLQKKVVDMICEINPYFLSQLAVASHINKNIKKSAFLKWNNLNVIFTGSLVDYLKTTEGSSLPMNTLIDMAAQARHFVCFLFFYYFIDCFYLLIHSLFSQHDPHWQESGHRCNEPYIQD